MKKHNIRTIQNPYSQNRDMSPEIMEFVQGNAYPLCIFCDCDGVINQLQSNFHIDPACVRVLAELVHTYDGRIVLTSTWRLGYYHNYKLCTPQVRKLIECFHENGIRDVWIQGRTADLGNRQQEIESYVKEHHIHYYIILDDDESLFTGSQHLYLVNPKTGLTVKDFKKIKKLLPRLLDLA